MIDGRVTEAVWQTVQPFGTFTQQGDDFNRAYGVDANIQLSSSQRLSGFLARTDSGGANAAFGSDYAGRASYNFTNNLWQVSGGYSQVGETFNPEVGFLPRRGYRRPEFRAFFQPQPKNIPWIRRFAPRYSYNAFYDFNGELQSQGMHIHPFEIQPRQGGRFGWAVDLTRDNPLAPFQVYNRDGNRVACLSCSTIAATCSVRPPPRRWVVRSSSSTRG